jgi:hypothetical protein
MSKPKVKVLFFDIETSPLEVYVWDLKVDFIPLNMIKTEWSILSWAAKWQGSDKVLYEDNQGVKDIKNDKELMKGIWKLLDEADIVITQNGKRFDVKKLNAKFIEHGMQPPSPYRHIDTYQISKKNFAFTSHSLAYLAKVLKCDVQKSSHKKFPGFELWRQCLSGNKEAWKEMELYNKLDVLTLEEVYDKLAPWDNSINFSVYYDGKDSVCSCGCTEFVKKGFAATNGGMYQRYKCKQCGKPTRSKENLLDKDKRKSLKVGSK